MKKENLLQRFFYFSSELMSRLSYPRKFLLIYFLFMIPMVLVFYFFLFEIRTSVDFTHKEKKGLEIIEKLSVFRQDVQKRRGMHSAFLNGDDSFTEIIIEKEKNIEKDIKAIDEVISRFNEQISTRKEWKKLIDEFKNLKNQKETLSSEESFYAHTAFIEKIILFERHIGDVSNLILDPKAETYHMIDTIINLFPRLGEDIGQLRAFGLSIPQNKELTREEKRFINNLLSSIRIAVTSLDQENNPMLNTIVGDDKKVLEASMFANKSSIEDLLDYLEKNFIDNGTMNISYVEYYSIMTKELDNLYLFSENIIPVIDGILQNRIDGEIMKRNLVSGVGLTMLFLAMYIFVGFYFSVKKTISELRDISERLTRGEGEGGIKLSTKDELGVIGDLFVNIGKNLTETNKTLEEDNNLRKEIEEKLNTRAKEMERINDFMIGREVKMVELKNEIKELLAKVAKKE